jgi:hypothetical protein
MADILKGKRTSWQPRESDELYKADFNGDGKDDIVVVNRKNWSKPYLSVLLANGDGFEPIVRYDRDLPGWGKITKNDQFIVGDYTGDGKDDIAVFNTKDFSIGYLLLLKSTGTNYSYVKRYDEILPGWDKMLKQDILYLADFNGDGKDDFIIRNYGDWNQGYVGLLRSNGNGLIMAKRYDKVLPNWGLIAKYDKIKVLDFDGDNRDDIVIHNCKDWSRCYFGAFKSNGNRLRDAQVAIASVRGWQFANANDLSLNPVGSISSNEN